MANSGLLQVGAPIYLDDLGEELFSPPPATDVLPLDVFKRYIRETHDFEDAEMTEAIETAMSLVEGEGLFIRRAKVISRYNIDQIAFVDSPVAGTVANLGLTGVGTFANIADATIRTRYAPVKSIRIKGTLEADNEGTEVPAGDITFKYISVNRALFNLGLGGNTESFYAEYDVGYNTTETRTLAIRYLKAVAWDVWSERGTKQLVSSTETENIIELRRQLIPLYA